MNERNHVDLFTGIGGFSCAARANGVRTIAMCECDPRCQSFLAKAWPGVPVWPDVRTFSLADACGNRHEGRARKDRQSSATQEGQGGVEIGVGGSRCMANPERAERGQKAQGWNEHNGNDSGREEAASGHPLYSQPVWLLTAGVPCQPASRAGKQRGKEDDRWLWPSALSVFAALRPAWALFENPPGIGDVGLAGILSDVEAQGYATRVFSVGACAVGAPHRRMRYWIVCRQLADASQAGREGAKWTSALRQPGAAPHGPVTECSQDELAHTPERGQREHGGAPGHAGHADQRGQYHWSNYVWLPCADGKVRRAPDDSFRLVDGLHRSVLGALGNSIVPQVAAEIIRTMILSESP